VTCCGIVCKAQEQVPIVQDLPDDQFIVQRNGKEYRALNADKIRELLKQRIDLEATQKINAELNTQIKEYKLQLELKDAQNALIQQKADSFKADFGRSQVDGKRNFELYMSERALRVEATQFVPHSNIKGFWGKVLTALDHPASQSFFKMGLPIFNAARCAR
jgi:hypothetical protein